MTGTVTLDGQPLADVEVSFAPEKGRPSTGRTDGSGRYELTYVGPTKGAKVGSHRVFIGLPSDDSDAGDAAPQDGGVRPVIPAKYNLRSTLTAEVQGGSNTLDFALDSK